MSFVCFFDVSLTFNSLCECEDSIIVNNNASAVMLMLNSICYKKEIIISRGQLVEIGGSFRIPDVISKSQSKMIEVGTTNKTQIKDKSQKESNLKKEIELIRKDLKKLNIKPGFKDNLDLSENLKILTKQLDKVRIENIKKDKSKNIIKDKKIGSYILRSQVLIDFPRI